MSGDRAFFFYLASIIDGTMASTFYRTLSRPLLHSVFAQSVSPPLSFRALRSTDDWCPDGDHAKAIPEGRRNCFRSLYSSSPLAASDIHAGMERNSETERGWCGPRITRSRIAAFFFRDAINRLKTIPAITLQDVRRREMYYRVSSF